MGGETSAEQARKKAASNARMTRVFTGLTLLVGIAVLGTVGYAIYQQPTDPEPLGTATVEVLGTPNTEFSGTVGTLTDEHDVSGANQLSLEVPYRQTDHVVATLQQDTAGTLTVRIRAQQEIVDDGQTNANGERVVLLWRAPRGEERA